MARKTKSRKPPRYAAVIEKIFFDRHTKGATEIDFKSDDLLAAGKVLRIKMPKNPPDILYSRRYRVAMPQSILATQPDGMEWIIEGRGKSKYAFKLARLNRIMPNRDLVAIKVPDATPEIISAYALTDEQALLAKVRYNRLIDVFLGVASYSLQSHLRTFVRKIGQIEIDEIYVAIDRRGRQFIIPVQAKGGKDRLGVTQTMQDMAYCAQKFPNLICRSIAAQFIASDLIALIELTLEEEQVKIVEERHYRLVPSKEITAEDLRRYGAA